MLGAVLDGATYEMVADQYAVTSTAMERRIKSAAGQLVTTMGIEGLRANGAILVQRLRLHHAAVRAAIAAWQGPTMGAGVRLLSDREVAAGARRIHRRSHRPE